MDGVGEWGELYPIFLGIFLTLQSPVVRSRRRYSHSQNYEVCPRHLAIHITFAKWRGLIHMYDNTNITCLIIRYCTVCHQNMYYICA